MPKEKVIKKNSQKKPCQIEVFDTEGSTVGKIDLPEKIFAAKVNKKLMAQSVRVYLANQRQGTQKTKSRSEVSFSKAKIYRQKGTGRARHGARSAPIFVGGGVAHGPKPRDFSLLLPKKMRRLALFSALSAKFLEKNILVIKGLEKLEAKTKAFVKVLDNLKMANSKLLLILPGQLENLARAARNVEGVNFTDARLLNAYLVLAAQKLLFLPESISVLETTFLKSQDEEREEKPKTATTETEKKMKPRKRTKDETKRDFT